jgi:hypothetical protein
MFGNLSDQHLPHPSGHARDDNPDIFAHVQTPLVDFRLNSGRPPAWQRPPDVLCAEHGKKPIS